MKICEVCNGLYEPSFHCDSCSSLLLNKGRVEDYLGPYSADMPIEEHLYCQHIYKCSICGKLENYNLKMVNY